MNNHFNYYNALNRNFFREDLYNAENNFSLNNNVNNSNSLNNILYGPYEGFIKGNLFKNLYQQYKNYQPAIITPKNEQEQAQMPAAQAQGRYGKGRCQADKNVFYVGHLPTALSAMGSKARRVAVRTKSNQK